MSELTDTYRKEFQDEETRHIYAEEWLNSYIATQIKVLREQAGWSQAELASKAGLKQDRISVLEDVNYSSWTAHVLKRIAKAFDMRLSIKIESFGTFLTEFSTFSRESLARPKFGDDSAFQTEVSAVATGSIADDWRRGCDSNQKRLTVNSIEEWKAKKHASAQQGGLDPLAPGSGTMKKAMGGER